MAEQEISMEDWEDSFWLRLTAEQQNRASQEREFNVQTLLDELVVERLPSKDALSTEEAKSLDVVAERLFALGRTVEGIKQEIQCRREMSKRFRRELDYQVEADCSSLKNLQGGMGYNTGVDRKRQQLEVELTNLKRERRSEALRCWKDIAALRKELMLALKEYESLFSLYRNVKL